MGGARDAPEIYEADPETAPQTLEGEAGRGEEGRSERGEEAISGTVVATPSLPVEGRGKEGMKLH